MLTPADIVDLRAYERERDDFRRRVIERKRRRRVALGPIMTLVFECADTVRFQVQEMARAEKIVTDEGIQAELDVYNSLLPSPGELSATLFIELTTEPDLRHWLPLLPGIERDIGIAIETVGAPADLVRSWPEEAHARSLTRDSITPAVHYLRFTFSEDEVSRFAAGRASLVADHPHYQAHAALSRETHDELLADLEGRTEPLAMG
ncbi:MAG: DUF3501 family protein [Actinomycetota bacterium]|nr:DUF3501 family protein [Actinomycetota bacterium]